MLRSLSSFTFGCQLERGGTFWPARTARGFCPHLDKTDLAFRPVSFQNTSVRKLSALFILIAYAFTFANASASSVFGIAAKVEISHTHAHDHAEGDGHHHSSVQESKDTSSNLSPESKPIGQSSHSHEVVFSSGAVCLPAVQLSVFSKTHALEQSFVETTEVAPNNPAILGIFRPPIA